MWHFADNFIKGFSRDRFLEYEFDVFLDLLSVYCWEELPSYDYLVSTASFSHAEKNAICAICVQSLQIFLCFVNDIAFVDFLSFSYDWHRSRLSGVLTASREFTRFWGGPDFCNCSPFCFVRTLRGLY